MIKAFASWIINLAILFDNINDQIGHNLAQEPLPRGYDIYQFKKYQYGHNIARDPCPMGPEFYNFHGQFHGSSFLNMTNMARNLYKNNPWPWVLKLAREDAIYLTCQIDAHR